MALRRVPRSGADTEDTPSAYGGRTARERGDVPADLVRVFVDEVTWFMSENKISRADLAQSMGVCPGRVSQILSGDENLTLRTLSSVVAALGLPAAWKPLRHPSELAAGGTSSASRSRQPNTSSGQLVPTRNPGNARSWA